MGVSGLCLHISFYIKLKNLYVCFNQNMFTICTSITQLLYSLLSVNAHIYFATPKHTLCFYEVITKGHYILLRVIANQSQSKRFSMDEDSYCSA